MSSDVLTDRTAAASTAILYCAATLARPVFLLHQLDDFKIIQAYVCCIARAFCLSITYRKSLLPLRKSPWRILAVLARSSTTLD